MSNTLATLAAFVCLGLITPQSVQAAERWFLMSRHGDCVEVGTLKRKVPDLGEINDPHAFATFMRRKGYEVISTPAPVPKGKGHEVKVPQKDLHLMFVTSEMCSGFGTR